LSPSSATGLKNRLFSCEFSLSQLAEITDRFAFCMQPPQVITFSGDLGSGKTTLIAALLKQYFHIDIAASPTFTLVFDYGDVAHFDLYRLTDPEEFERMGWDESFDRMAFIEWPERLEGRLPSRRVDVELEHINETKRRITVDAIS